MSRRDDERIAVARRRLIELLSAEDHVLPGGVVDRMMRCGKVNCRCSTDPTQFHGPYHQWGYSKQSQRYTRRLSDAQFERYGPEIDRGRQLTELLAQLYEAEIRRVERTERWGA